MRLAEALTRPRVGPRVIFITDIHGRNRGPKMRTDNWRQTVIDKISWVLDAAIQLGAERTVLGGGDLFDVPKVDLEVADDIIDVFLTRGFGFATVFGNHDIENNLSGITRVVLGHLMRRSESRITPLPVMTNSQPLLLGNMQIWGHHYKYNNHLDPKENEDDEQPKSLTLRVPVTQHAGPRVIVSHSMLLATPPGNWPEGSYTTYDALETNADLILLGHYHPMQPMQRLNNAAQTLIGGPGALMRGALTRDNLQREPSFALIEHNEKTGTLEVEFIPIEIAAPASQIFKLEEAEAEARRNDSLDSFRSELENMHVQSLDIATLIEQLAAAENVPDDVRQEALLRLGVL